jgi:hypothetical protein
MPQRKKHKATSKKRRYTIDKVPVLMKGKKRKPVIDRVETLIN